MCRTSISAILPGTSSPEEKIEIARRAEAEALRTDPRITNSEGAEYWDRTARVYATASGFAAGYATSSFGISVVPVASQNGEMQRDGWHSTARRRERLIHRRRSAASPPSGTSSTGLPQGQDRRGSRRLRAGDGGQPDPVTGVGRQRAQPLPPGLLPL